MEMAKSKFKRKGISKKKRFSVFKRDDFTCQYCGSHPPNVVLHVDHIHPVSKGGTNEEENLITSCFSCNNGKGAETLDVAPISTEKKIEIQKEKLDQYEGYLRLVDAKSQLINDLIGQVDEAYTECFENF